MKLTSYQRVADALLRHQGTTLTIFVLDRHEAGMKPHGISRELYDATDGAVDVTAQAVRNWIDQFAADEAEVPA